MVADVDVAPVARLLADSARARMLAELQERCELPAGELARRAGVSPSTASEHLTQLIKSGLVTARRSGRHRYYRLGSDDVARAFEALAAIAPPVRARTLRQAATGEALAAARTCYDHLAGMLGVIVTEALVQRRALVDVDRAFEIGPRAQPVLRMLGVDIQALTSRRPVVRWCLDWSERRPHVAGALGAAICANALAEGWIERLPGSRAVRLTPAGRKAFAEIGASLT